MALESTLGDYYRPLYDEYNIFGLKSVGDSGGQATENLKRRITEVIDNSVNTQSRFNAYPLTISEPQITQVTGLLDYGGELYRKQAVEYAKYDEFAQLLEILLEKCNLLEEQSETSTVLQEKMALEEELAEIDERILTLMELIDGIQFSGNEIRTDRHGNVLTQDYFIKMLQTGDCSAISMGINNAKIYDSLRDKYFNPIPVLETLRSEGEIYIDNKRKVETCEETLKDIAEQADAKISYLEELIENKAETAVIEEVKAQIAELNEVYEKICEENQNYRELLDESYSNGYDRIYEMETVFSSVRYLTDDALQTIRYIKDKQDTIRPKVMDFGETLSRISDVVSTELLSDFNNSYENMKKYVGIDTEAIIPDYDIDGMETTLSSNMRLLNSLDICRIKDMPTDVSEEGEIAWFSRLDESIEKYTGLRYEGLYFDYSNIQFETQKNTILSGFTELFASSFYDLLIPDYDTTSEKEIMDGNLPSEWIGVAYESGMENPTEDIEDKSGSELLAITDNSADIGNISDVLKDSMVNIIEKIMFIMYLRGNFNNYLSTEKREDRPTEYEIEYIICGHPEDRDNLEAIAFRILMLRLIINTVHVFTDSDKVTQANTFAMSVVGFTGLPFLTALVKYVVLFIWAFEQSAIETMAIMMGREIPYKGLFCSQV